MQTNIVRDSSIGDAWIQEMLAKNPIQWVIGPDGQRTGNLISGPVRLNYPNLLKKSRKKQKQPDGQEIMVEGNFNTGMLFVPGVDVTALNEAYNAQLAIDCKDFYDPVTGQYYGLHSPFRDQAEKTVGKNTRGYTPGGLLLNCSSNFQPVVVDRNMNPIVDEKRIYSGVWAFVSMNVYSYGIKTNQPKKGVGFGLVSVMIIADDDHLDNGAPVVDPRTQFGGVNVAPPAIQPAAMFGQMAPQAPVMPNTNAAFVTPPASPAQVPAFIQNAVASAPAMSAAPAQNFAPPAAPAAPAMKLCWQCSKPMPSSFMACPHCGVAQA